jgi:hypothetical protein
VSARGRGVPGPAPPLVPHTAADNIGALGSGLLSFAYLHAISIHNAPAPALFREARKSGDQEGGQNPSQNLVSIEVIPCRTLQIDFIMLVAKSDNWQ